MKDRYWRIAGVSSCAGPSVVMAAAAMIGSAGPKGKFNGTAQRMVASHEARREARITPS